MVYEQLCHSLKAYLFPFFLLVSSNWFQSVGALNIGVQAIDASVSVYCGLLYSGCPREKPCDGLDACCMKHDACVQSKNNAYLSQECSQTFLNCMTNFKKAGGRTFKGNTCDAGEVIEVISVVMEAALLAGRYLHKP
ncbi:hypothetical protein G4B88_025243 [Cannabis sativa]|uniref:Phospholipase A2-alpha n=1 Tax=Cannabis sativa TaxID=3483 RepID=A0A7J6HS93_CANSA|nr:hypothetical protein G4B88_025243 [Cannabis sativa]